MITPMADLAMASRNPELLQRLGVTLAAVVLYRIGCWIPLPGIDISTLLGYGNDLGSFNTNIERISIMALGVVPLLSMLTLVELAMLIAPPFRAWAQREPNAANLDGWIVVGALAIAAFQANGVAVALEGIDTLAPSPGLAFRAGIIGAFVAATAFLIWLAAVVTRHGLGSGFLLLLAVPLVIAIPSMLATQAVAWGPASELSIPLTLAFLAAATAGLVVAGMRRPSLAGNGQLLWPALLAYGLAGWLLVPLMFAFAPETFAALVETVKIGQPARVVLMPALTLAFYFWRARSLAIAGEPQPAGDWVTPLILALIVATSEFLLSMLPLPLIFDGRGIIIIVCFALGLVGTVQALWRPSLERGS
jgi:preprotein translocase subunit SecY